MAIINNKNYPENKTPIDEEQREILAAVDDLGHHAQECLKSFNRSLPAQPLKNPAAERSMDGQDNRTR